MFTSDIWMKVNLICSLVVVGSRQAALIQNAHLLFATTVCRANVGLYKGQFCWKECFVDKKMRGKLFICAELKPGDRWAKQAEEDLNSCWQTIEICGHRKHRLIETAYKYLREASWSGNSEFLSQTADGSHFPSTAWILSEPTFLVSAVQTAGVSRSVMAWKLFLSHWTPATAYLSAVTNQLHPFMASVWRLPAWQ